MATRILVADDSTPLRVLVGRVLLLRGYEVLEAADGDQALAILRQERPAVAILDVVMPGLSGLDVCRAARADPGLAALGIIILSANATAEHARLAGADRFISKPFLPSELLMAVDDVRMAASQRTVLGSLAPERL